MSSSDVASHFKKHFGNKFIYQNNKLYYFNGVYWKSEDKKQLITLNNFISEVYYFFVSEHISKYIQIIGNNNTLETEEKHRKVVKVQQFHLYLLELLNYDKRQKYINEILCKLHNEEIKFDENPYYFAFNNKIYDLKQGKFISPEPEQYISITTGYNYEEDNDINEKVIVVDNLINTILTQPEIKALYLTILSTGLDGIPLEKFVLANGGGGNGKGLLNELVEVVLGDYCYILPSHVLTAPLKTGSNPELANMNNKRLVFFKEPNKDQKFNMATVKDITGGGSINARLNYSNDTKTNLNITFIGECNDKPKSSEVNPAVARRILDIPFKSSFVDQKEYDELTSEQKKYTSLTNYYYKTKEFKNKYKQALFLILAKHHKEFLNNNRVLDVPDEIINRNKSYLASSDELFNWFEDNYDKTDNKDDTIKLKPIYENFKCSEYFNNLNKKEKRENNYKTFVEKLKNNMFLKKFVKENKDKVYIITNYVSKEEDDDEENPLGN